MKKISNALKKRGFPAKLDALTPVQEQELIAWLTKEGISYRVAVQRVKDQFGLSVSHSSMGLFWQRKCRPGVPLPVASGKVLLDVIFEASSPIRLRAVDQDGSVKLMVVSLADKNSPDDKPETNATSAGAAKTALN